MRPLPTGRRNGPDPDWDVSVRDLLPRDFGDVEIGAGDHDAPGSSRLSTTASNCPRSSRLSRAIAGPPRARNRDGRATTPVDGPLAESSVRRDPIPSDMGRRTRSVEVRGLLRRQWKVPLAPSRRRRTDGCDLGGVLREPVERCLALPRTSSPTPPPGRMRCMPTLPVSTAGERRPGNGQIEGSFGGSFASKADAEEAAWNVRTNGGGARGPQCVLSATGAPGRMQP